MRFPARLAIAVASALALAALPCAAEADFSTRGADVRGESVIHDQMISEPARMTEALINQYRASLGLAPVALDPAIEAVAYQQARAMADRDAMDHNIAGDFASRMRAHRLGNVSGGENLGRNYRTADSMFQWWANSPVHAANMANPRVSRLGVAVVYSASGRPYWAMIVASR